MLSSVFDDGELYSQEALQRQEALTQSETFTQQPETFTQQPEPLAQQPEPLKQQPEALTQQEEKEQETYFTGLQPEKEVTLLQNTLNQLVREPDFSLYLEQPQEPQLSAEQDAEPRRDAA